jgi:hypothetical protein
MQLCLRSPFTSLKPKIYVSGIITEPTRIAQEVAETSELFFHLEHRYSSALMSAIPSLVPGGDIIIGLERTTLGEGNAKAT